MNDNHNSLLYMSSGQVLVNEDWEMFQDCFPDIGCIKLFRDKSRAYMDGNAARLLSYPVGFDNCLTEKEFYELKNSFTESRNGLSSLCEYNGREFETRIKTSETSVIIFIRAMSDNHVINVEWDEKALLNDIIGRNLLSYHLQPIVDARNGNIVAYEALMRTEGDIHIPPTQLIEMAARNNKLYEIEKCTFVNVLTLISEHEEMFDDKKVFINSIPGAILTAEDSNDIIERFGDLFCKVVIEITEHTELTDEVLSKISERYAKLGCEIAIDDFGSGYANSSSLLRVLPDYVKLDQQLISSIDHDYNKQQLVSGYIAFCKANGIMVLAEGVEDLPEMKWVIRAGVDLIQGFFTSRPQSVIVCSIPREVQTAIVKTNLEKPDNALRKTYMSKTDNDINILKLAEKKYTDIVINTDTAVLRGVYASTYNINIRTENNLNCRIALSNVNLRGIWKPTIIIGENSNVELVIDGKNVISYEGIVVPTGSSLLITGGGDLAINADHNNGTGIGGNFETPYGNIIVDMRGSLEVTANGDRSVCVGGGKNPDNSVIDFKRGNITLLATGVKSLAAGNYEGRTNIAISAACHAKVRNAGDFTVGIGTFEGECNINLSGSLELTTSGKEAVGIGSMYCGTGEISVSDADVQLAIKSRHGASLGSIGGNVNVDIQRSRLFCKGEGECVSSIGDTAGSGNITVSGSDITVTHASGDESIQIGTLHGHTEIAADCNIRGVVYNSAEMTV